MEYVKTHRVADPGLSKRGNVQAEKLAEYLSKRLEEEGSSPAYFVVSPMQRAVDTIMPTIRMLNENALSKDCDDVCEGAPRCKICVNAYYHEVEGCHLKNKPHPGMNQIELASHINSSSLATENETFLNDISFEGFSEVPEEGWYCHGKGAENRVDAENRASTFYMWLCEYLDSQINETGADDVIDAGVRHLNSDGSIKKLGRRTVILLGHGEFMGYILKRIMAGFGYTIEHSGVTHRKYIYTLVE